MTEAEKQKSSGKHTN